MRTEKLIDQLEMYSNAILGFIVAQSLAFSFTFGTNASFSCVVAEEPGLAVGLATHFAISTALAVTALRFLSRSIRRLSEDNQPLVRTLFRAKAAVVVLFAVIPIAVLLTYGVLEHSASKRCPPSPRQATVNSK